MKKLLIVLGIFLVAFIGYIKYALYKFDYDFIIKKYVPVRIDLRNEAIINVVVDIALKSSFFFSIPVNLLYYEIYFKGNLLGKSAGQSSFTIKPGPSITNITESIDLYVDKKNMEIALNYISKTPTDFTAKIIIDLFGIKTTLKNISFTY